MPPFLRNSRQGLGHGGVRHAARAPPRRARSARRRAGKVGGRTQEIQRLIGRSLRSVTKLPDLGERTIWIDCDVIQADGGTRTASITGGFVALALALQRMRDLALIQDIPLTDFVAATSVGIVDGAALLDLAYDEDSRAEVDMNFVKTGDGRFIELQGTAEGKPFDRRALDALMALADNGHQGTDRHPAKTSSARSSRSEAPRRDDQPGKDPRDPRHSRRPAGLARDAGRLRPDARAGRDRRDLRRERAG